MDRWLYVAGAVPFVVLGLLHMVYTLMDLATVPRYFAPRDRELVSRMDATGMRLTKETTMWRAWLGFNLSHALGVLVFGLAGLYVALARFDLFAAGMREVLYVMPLIALAYFLMSIRYWFRIPTIGSGAGTVLMAAGALAMTWA